MRVYIQMVSLKQYDGIEREKIMCRSWGLSKPLVFNQLDICLQRLHTALICLYISTFYYSSKSKRS